MPIAILTMTRLARLRDEWGAQAQWDAWAVESLLTHVGHVVPHTLLPVLRMTSGEPERVDRAYAALKAQTGDDPITRESPRARWRRHYGGFVREIEWATGELVQQLAEAEVERLVVDEVSRGVEAWLSAVKPGFASLYAKDHGRQGDAYSLRARLGRVIEQRLGAGAGKHLASHLFDPFNVVSFMVGEIEVESFDAAGSLQLHIPACSYHTVAGSGQPQTRGCLWVCKAACERVFGVDAPITLHFEPQLPLLSCRMRMTWDPERLRAQGFSGEGAAKKRLPVLT